MKQIWNIHHELCSLPIFGIYFDSATDLANGFLQTNPTGNGVATATSGQKANNIDPGVGLRYQF